MADDGMSIFALEETEALVKRQQQLFSNSNRQFIGEMDNDRIKINPLIFDDENYPELFVEFVRTVQGGANGELKQFCDEYLANHQKLQRLNQPYLNELESPYLESIF